MFNAFTYARQGHSEETSKVILRINSEPDQLEEVKSNYSMRGRDGNFFFKVFFCLILREYDVLDIYSFCYAI